MSIGDDIEKLGDLHRRGVLSDDEFARAKAAAIGKADSSAASGAPPLESLNTLRRSRDDRWIGGVCAGLARGTGTQAWLWRLAFVLFVLCGGCGLVAYLLLWFFVPLDPPRFDGRPQQLHAG